MEFFSDTPAILDAMVLMKTSRDAQGGKFTPVGVPKDLSQNNIAIKIAPLSLKGLLRETITNPAQDIVAIIFNHSI